MTKQWPSLNEQLEAQLEENELQCVEAIVNILKHDEFFAKYRTILDLARYRLLGQESILEDELHQQAEENRGPYERHYA